MKILVIILFIVVLVVGYQAFKPELKFSPMGDTGVTVHYFTDASNETVCSICNENISFYKADSKGRIVGIDCYNKDFRYK